MNTKMPEGVARPKIEPTIERIAILSAVSGGVNSPKRLRYAFAKPPEYIRNRIYELRRAGFLCPWRGGRDYTLKITSNGLRILAGVFHGLRAMTVKKQEKKLDS